MRKTVAIICCMFAFCACDKHDPILPGVRTAIFDTSRIDVKNQTIADIPESAVLIDNTDCPYTQDASNTIWDGTRKIFSGFPTNNTVANSMQPVCSGNYVYAGLSTGEVVKLNPRTRQIMWIADIYRPSNMTGGASMVDIVVPPFPYKNAVYAGGLGDAFCKLSATNGNKLWCVQISVGLPFIIAGNYAFVVANDGNLYAIRTTDGSVLWKADTTTHVAPEYANGTISVGDERIDVATGKIIL